MRERKYTLDEANATLVCLAEVLARMATLRDQLGTQQNELMSMMQHRSGNGAVTHDQEIEEGQGTLDNLAAELRQGLQEIADRGIIVRDISSGLVDFPAERDGQDIFLCWIRGEYQIDYWHGTNEGFASRKPL